MSPLRALSGRCVEFYFLFLLGMLSNRSQIQIHRTHMRATHMSSSSSTYELGRQHEIESPEISISRCTIQIHMMNDAHSIGIWHDLPEESCASCASQIAKRFHELPMKCALHVAANELAMRQAEARAAAPHRSTISSMAKLAEQHPIVM